MKKITPRNQLYQIAEENPGQPTTDTGEPDQCDTIQKLTFNAVMRFHEYNT